MKELGEKITKEITSAEGTWGVVLENLTTNESWTHLPDEKFNAASIIKIPIMMAAFEAHHQGAFAMEDKLTLRAEDIVAGMGVFQHMTPGTEFTVYDTIMMMIIQSDNTATNMVINLVGKKQIQALMKNIGLKDSMFYNTLMTMPVEREGVNTITATDVNQMLKTIVEAKYTSAYACEHMTDIMKRQQDSDRLPARLPGQSSHIIGSLKEWSLAHKTGTVSGVVHDVGVLYVHGQQILITILSKDVDNYFGELTIANMGLHIYNSLK